MKKRLITLWVAWLLAWTPNANAEINSTKEWTNKDLIETISNNQTTPTDSASTISFDEARKLNEHKELIEKLLTNENIKQLIAEYWEEDVANIINEILKNWDVDEIIDKAINNEDLQKAMEEWNDEEVAKILQEIIDDFYHVRPAWWRIADKVSYWVTFVIVWELLKKRKEW